MKDYQKVIEIIEDDFCYMTSKEEFLKLVGGNPAIEAIKDYVESFTDEELYKNYDEDEYIIAFLKDLVLCAMNDERFKDAKIYVGVLYNLYKDR